MNKKSKNIILILSTFLLLLSCEMHEKKSKTSPKLKLISIESEALQKKPFLDSMSNPIMTVGFFLFLFQGYFSAFFADC